MLRVRLLVLAVLALGVLPANAYKPSCPTWAAWSSHIGPSSQPLHPTIFGIMSKKTINMAIEEVKQVIMRTAHMFKIDWSGQEGDLNWQVKDFHVNKVAVDEVSIKVPVRNTLDLNANNIEIYFSYNLETTGSETQKYTVTTNYKFVDLNPRFDVENENGLLKLSLFWCKLTRIDGTVNLQAGISDKLADMFGSNKPSEIEIKKQLQNNICDALEARAQRYLTKHISAENVQPISENISLLYPFWYFVIDRECMHLVSPAWMQHDATNTYPGLSLLHTGIWRQLINKHRLLGVASSTNYACHDDNFMFHYAFTKYFLDDFFAELFEKNLINLSTKTTKDVDLLNWLAMTCQSECMGKLLSYLSEKYPMGLMEFSFSVKTPPKISFNDGWVKVFLNDGLMRISINDNVTHEPLLWLGSLDVDYSAWSEPVVEGNRIKVHFGPDRQSVKLDDKNLLHVPNSEPVDAALQLVIKQFLLEQIKEISKIGIPLPKLKNAEIVNATITSVEYELLQVSVDLV